MLGNYTAGKIIAAWLWQHPKQPESERGINTSQTTEKGKRTFESLHHFDIYNENGF